jgi:hypothetical protein
MAQFGGGALTHLEAASDLTGADRGLVSESSSTSIPEDDSWTLPLVAPLMQPQLQSAPLARERVDQWMQNVGRARC